MFSCVYYNPFLFEMSLNKICTGIVFVAYSVGEWALCIELVVEIVHYMQLGCVVVDFVAKEPYFPHVHLFVRLLIPIRLVYHFQ